MRALAPVAIVAFAMMAPPAQGANSQCPWRVAWASAQMVPNSDDAYPGGALAAGTIRQIVRPTIGGTAMRVRISNAFGTTPLRIAGASLARSSDNRTADIVVTSAVPLRFTGRADAVVPPGGEWLSDPVSGPVAAFTDIAISLQLAAEPDIQTSHPGSRATSYIAQGTALSAGSLTAAKALDHWYYLSGVEVQSCTQKLGVAVLGDSITDGRGSTTNGNDRWTDFLARRFGGKRAVINQGIGGNRILFDGLGPNALARLDRDVLAQPGIGYLIVLEGVNDLGSLTRKSDATQADYDALVAQLTGAYTQIVERSHARGMKVYGATILPFGASDYYHATHMAETARKAINTWIRAKGNFDGVIDFDQVIRDPARPDRIAPAFDTGDGLHPNPVGFRVMADAVPLALFE